MYTKTNWSDRVVENPSTYTMRNNSDGTITLISAPGTVQNSGTPIKAEYLNNIEKGIEDAHQFFDEIKEDFLPSNHPSASFGYNSETGRITHNGNDVKVKNAEKATNSTQWNGLKVVKTTKSSWESLANKDANTLYLW